MTSNARPALDAYAQTLTGTVSEDYVIWHLLWELMDHCAENGMGMDFDGMMNSAKAERSRIAMKDELRTMGRRES